MGSFQNSLSPEEPDNQSNTSSPELNTKVHIFFNLTIISSSAIHHYYSNGYGFCDVNDINECTLEFCLWKGDKYEEKTTPEM